MKNQPGTVLSPGVEVYLSWQSLGVCCGSAWLECEPGGTERSLLARADKYSNADGVLRAEFFQTLHCFQAAFQR